MHPVRPLIAFFALSLSLPGWTANPPPVVVASPAPAAVNPYTGMEASVADLKKTLEIERLRTQIAEEKQRQKRADVESRKADSPDVGVKSGQFGTLKFPTDKMPDLAAMFFTPDGKKPLKGKQTAQPSAVTAPPVLVAATAPMVPIVPRLVGVIRDEGGRVAIIEQGGVLRQAKEGESAHGLKVTKIGDGWAEVGGKRLAQDSSTLALVTNVDKQPVARVASAGGVSSVPAPSLQPSPAAPGMPFMPPNFQSQP